MRDRRQMTIMDWINAAFLVVIGVLIGQFLHGLFQLDGSAFWITAIGAPVLVGLFLLCVTVFDGIFDRIFPSGIKPAHPDVPRKAKPLVILMSLPVGIAIGLIAAQLGWSGLL